MPDSIHKRPDCAERLAFRPISAEQPRANSEQQSAAQRQRFHRRIAPWERLEQRKPSVLQLRQLAAGDAAWEELGRYRLQPRLGWRGSSLVQIFKALAPPGQPDRSKLGEAARRHHIREGEIQVPQSNKGRTNSRGSRLESNLPIIVEPPLSDR